MSAFDLPDPDSCDRRAVTRSVAGASPRARLVLTGRIVRYAEERSSPTGSALYTLDDGTGTVELVFLGRPVVAGLGPGTRCTVEGTALVRDGRLQIWNPRYRIEAERGSV